MATLPPGPSDPPEHRIAAARVAFSVAARTISDSARASVPVPSGHAAPGGALVVQARRLEQQAQELLELAIIVERESGTSWEDIGHALGVTRQAAHQRFSAACQHWYQALRRSWTLESDADPMAQRLSPGAEDPERWARLLDDWVLRHREPIDPDPGPHPVSGSLPRPSPAEQERLYLQELTALTQLVRSSTRTPLTPEAERVLLQRRLELLEQLAVLRPSTSAYAEAAAHARRHLAQRQAAPDQQRQAGGDARPDHDPSLRS